MTKEELLEKCINVLKRAFEDKRTKLRIKLEIPRLMREYAKISKEDF